MHHVIVGRKKKVRPQPETRRKALHPLCQSGVFVLAIVLTASLH